MALVIPTNDLSIFLTNRKVANIDIHAMTSISTVELSKLRNGRIKSIPALKLAQIALSINNDIGDVVQKVYPTIKLLESYSTKTNSKATPLGNYLKGIESNTLDIISENTGITITRLKILITSNSAILLAHELYLIELATNVKPGTIFKELYKDLRINNSELQNYLRDKEKNKSRKKSKDLNG